MKKLSIISFVTATVLLTAGCGGGGGGSSSNNSGGNSNQNGNNNSYKNITGYIIDPAVKGANVSLVCGQKEFSSNQQTDDKGFFNIREVSSSNIDFSSCSVVSIGGNDGQDLTGLELRAPYSLYNKDTGILVTPFTTVLSMYDTIKSDINGAKNAVAKFFGVSEEDLLKNPEENVALAKITKKITTIALTKDSSGQFIGIIDIDSIMGNNLSEYIEQDLVNKLSYEDMERLKDTLEAIDKAISVDDVKRLSIESTTLELLKKAFKQDNYSNGEIENLKYLASKITQANIKDTQYQIVTKYHLRKALSDINMTPSFDNELQTQLIQTLKDTLALNSSDFKLHIDSKDIKINDIEGFVLFDSSKYYKILGDDNDARRNYYTYSDKSNIAKALSLASDNYSDSVNDPINNQVALGFAKLGFYDEALEQIRDGVYQPTEMIAGYKNLAKSLVLELQQPTKAVGALLNQFEILKASIESVGRSNLTNEQRADIQVISRRFSQAKDYNNSYKVLEYMREVVPYMGKTNPYGGIAQAIYVLSNDFYSEDGDYENAKKYTKTGAEITNDIPTDNLALVEMYALRFAINSMIYGDNQTGRNLLQKVETLRSSPKTSFSYPWMKVVTNALDNKDLTTMVSDFTALNDSNKMNGMLNGLAAALFLSGSNGVDKLFEILNDKNIFKDSGSTNGKARIMDLTTTLGGSASGLSNLLIIKMHSTATELETYIDRVNDMMKSWDMSSNTASQKQQVYGQWGNGLDNRYGAMAIASIYKDLNREDKAKDTITFAINKIVDPTFTSSAEKITGIINILDATAQMGLQTTSEREILLQNLYNAANSDATKLETIVKVSTILAINDKKIEAKALADKAYGLIEALNSGNLVNIRDKRTLYLVGDYSKTTNLFASSVANAYFQAGDIVKAKEIIQESLNSINTLVESVDQYKQLVNIAIAYGNINDKNSLLPIINRIKTKKEREEAIVQAATALSNYDAFSKSNVATVDSDNDGRPDFFNVGVTQEQIATSGLVLDDDIDGDGILDINDTLPYDNVR